MLNDITNIALQIHWHNPQKLSGLRDGSGVAIWYTKNLRQYDADMMRVVNSGVSIGNVGLSLEMLW